MTDHLRVPVDLVGSHDEVRRRVRPRVQAFVAGGLWAPVPDERETVDVPSVDGLVVLSGPAPLLARGSHVQAFLPLSLLCTAVIEGRVPHDREDDAVAASLESAWGLLGLISPANQLLILPVERHRAVAAAAVRFWPELDSVGARYTVGLPEGARLWELPTGLRYVLGQLGVPGDRLVTPLPGEDLSAVFTDGISPPPPPRP